MSAKKIHESQLKASSAANGAGRPASTRLADELAANSSATTVQTAAARHHEEVVAAARRRSTRMQIM